MLKKFTKISICAHTHPILYMLYSSQYRSNYSLWFSMHSNSTDIHGGMGYPLKGSTFSSAASKNYYSTEHVSTVRLLL